MSGGNKLICMVDFYPATLHEGKEWVVKYYVKHPDSGTLVRKRIKLNRIHSITERRKMGKRLCHDLNKKLSDGWNPFLAEESPKAFHLLYGAISTYWNEKIKETRPDTIRTYKSYINILKEWITENKSPDMYAGTFSRMDAVSYCNYLCLYVTKI